MQDEVELGSRITTVAVYVDRARVTRGGTVDLEAGIHQLGMRDLPRSLDPASVRAAARGTVPARLLGVDVQQRFYSETPAERVRQLEKEVESLSDELRSLDAQAELLKTEQAALADLAGQSRVFARGLSTGKNSPESHMALLDSLRRRRQEINDGLLALDARQREGKRLLEKLQNELGQLRSSKGRERYTAVIEVEMPQPGQLTVDLSYVVSGAGWQPLYDIRLVEESESPALEIGYLSQVTQQTGEDWQQVALSLSTARPALAEVVPELDPWYIQPPPPAPIRAGIEAQSLKRAAPPPGATMDMLAEAEPKALEYAAAEQTTHVESSAAAVSYHVPGTVTVPSDGDPHKLTVARFQLSPDMDYTAAPKLVEAAYRRAQTSNDSPYTLLPGTANLFAGDEFIGSTRLDLTAPQGEMELFLGVDDRIKVERELTGRQVDKRLMGNKRRQHYRYQISLTNSLPVQAQITLLDQLPVSRHEDIKVKVETIEPEPDEHDSLNMLRWELTLAPGGKTTVIFGFTVEYPQDMPVIGLP